MAEYRVGRHWGVTIVREGRAYAADVLDDCAFCCVGGTSCPLHPPVEAQLVAVVVNGDTALAERICALLNRDPDAFINDVLSGTPDSWDDDAAAESIAVSYVRELERRVIELGGSLERCPEADAEAPGAPAHGTGR